MVFSVLRISTRLEKEARMGAWNSKQQADVLGMVYARKRATDENALCYGIQTGMLMGSWGRAGRVHATLRGGHLQEGVGPGGRDMSQGGFLAWSVCLKEGVFVYTVCVVKD